MTFDDWRSCVDYLLKALTREMAHRTLHTDWVERERWAITAAANAWASEHKLPLIAAADVERVEHQAVGHVDYAKKLAIQVADLLYGVKP